MTVMQAIGYAPRAGELDAEQHGERVRRLPQTLETVHEILPGSSGSRGFAYTTLAIQLPDDCRSIGFSTDVLALWPGSDQPSHYGTSILVHRYGRMVLLPVPIYPVIMNSAMVRS